MSSVFLFCFFLSLSCLDEAAGPEPAAFQSSLPIDLGVCQNHVVSGLT